MKEGTVHVTPLAGRTTVKKKEAITGSVVFAVLILLLALIILRALAYALGFTAPFWVISALLLAACGLLFALLFRRVLYDASSSAALLPYTVAYRSDGYIELCHRDGRREYFPVRQIADVRAFPSKLGVALYGWAYAGNLNYGKITFYLSDGGRYKRRSVKMVAGCKNAARFIREDFLPTVNGVNDCVSAMPQECRSHGGREEQSVAVKEDAAAVKL